MRQHIIKRILTAICAIAIYSIANAAPDSIPTLRPVLSSYSIEAGNAHTVETYLTPLHYRGNHYAVNYERTQAMRFKPQRWVMQLKLGFMLDDTKNPAKNATMYNAAVEGRWAMMHRWNMPMGLTLGLGGSTSLHAGVLYLTRNGNNPAQADVGWTVDLTGYASWTGRIWRLPLTLRYQPTLPVTGAFFSPDYGELYYQIYLGDHGRLVYGAWPGNYFRMDNLITADLHFGNTSVRLGYHGNIFSSKVNNIVTQNITHSLVVGITTEWISLRPNAREIEARIISSY